MRKAVAIRTRGGFGRRGGCQSLRRRRAADSPAAGSQRVARPRLAAKPRRTHPGGVAVPARASYVPSVTGRYNMRHPLQA